MNLELGTHSQKVFLPESSESQFRIEVNSDFDFDHTNYENNGALGLEIFSELKHICHTIRLHSMQITKMMKL